MPKTSQTKKTKLVDIGNDSIKQEEVASKLDTIISLLEKLINTVSKEKGLTSNDLFPHSK